MKLRSLLFLLLLPSLFPSLSWGQIIPPSPLGLAIFGGKHKATVYYGGSHKFFVDGIKGNDNNRGWGTSDSAWRTTTKVFGINGGGGHTFTAGDTIAFKFGQTFIHSDTIGIWMEAGQGGSAGSPVLYTSYGSGSNPIIRKLMNRRTDPYSTIHTHTASYVTFDHLTIDTCWQEGFLLFGNGTDGTSHDITIQYCDISAVGIGISTTARNTKILHNNIHDLRHMVVDSTSSAANYGAEAIVLESSHNEVGWNTVSNACALEYTPGVGQGYSGSFVQWVSDAATRCDTNNVHNNTVVDCQRLMELSSAGGVGHHIWDGVLSYNTFISTNRDSSLHGRAHGMTIHLQGTGGGSNGADLRRFKIDNNTFYSALDTTENAIIYWNGTIADSMMKWQNNIVYMTSSNPLIAIESNFYSSEYGTITGLNNIYFNPTQTITLGPRFLRGPNDLIVDPTLTNTTIGSLDFHLQVGSPAINTGRPLSYTADHDSTLIVGLPDIGAYETSTAAGTLYKITPTAYANGTIYPSDSAIVASGKNTQFYATGNPNYVVQADSVDHVKVDSTTSYTFTNVTAAHSFSASFKIDPNYTFIVGDSTILNNADTKYAGNIYLRPLVTYGNHGTVLYVKWYTGTSNSANANCAVYATSAGKPGALLGQATALTGIGNNSWKQFNFVSPPTVSADTIWVAIWGSANINDTQDDGGASGVPGVKDLWYKAAAYTGNFPDPLGTPDGSTDFGQHSGMFLRMKP